MATPEPISLAQQTKHQFKKKTFYNSRQCAYWYARDCRISLCGEPALTDWLVWIQQKVHLLWREGVSLLWCVWVVAQWIGSFDRRGKRYW